MKYIKTNEGFFSKVRIPKDLIQSVKRNLQVHGTVIDENDYSPTSNNFDKVSLTCDTEIGPIKVEIVFFKESKFKSTNVRIIFMNYGTEIERRNCDLSEIDLKTGLLKKSNSDLFNIEPVISRLMNIRRIKEESRKRKLEKEKKLPVDDIKELFYDISDILGKYTLDIKTKSHPHDDSVTLVFKFESEHLNNISTSQNGIFVVNDQHNEIMNELYNIFLKLKGIFNLHMFYKITNSKLSIIVTNNDKKHFIL